jgi:GntR family transcriptional regulator, rspAB operon transcriptional repressor
MTDEKSFVLLEREKHEPVREYAIRTLDYNISNLLLKPGQLVSEKRISLALGISMTPVREAFFSLSQIGIIEIYPQKGSVIALIDPAFVEESRFVRWAVERSVVEVACSLITDADITELRSNLLLQQQANDQHDILRMLSYDNQFHEKIFQIARKNMTYAYISRLRVHFDRVRMLNLMATDTGRNINEHRRLVDLLELRDVQSAVKLVDIHLNHVTYDIVKMKESYPQYFK